MTCTECEVREAYAGPEGLIEHNTHILEARTKLFEDYADDHFMTVYGEPSEPLLDLLKAHRVGHTWFYFLEGLGPSPVVPSVILGAERGAKQRARCIPGESAYADVRGRSLLSRPAFNPGWNRRSGDCHAA
jgi:hypothetical protein